MPKKPHPILLIVPLISLASACQRHAEHEDVSACSVVSDQRSEDAYNRSLKGGDQRVIANEAVAKAARCLERTADRLSYLPEPADNIARTALWECQANVAVAKSYSRYLSVANASDVDKFAAGAGSANLQPEDAEARAYDLDMKEHALSAVIEARHHSCRGVHDL